MDIEKYKRELQEEVRKHDSLIKEYKDALRARAEAEEKVRQTCDNASAQANKVDAAKRALAALESVK